MESPSSAKPSDNTTDSPYATSSLRRAHTVAQGGRRRNVVAKNLGSSREKEEEEEEEKEDNEGLARARAPTADSPLRTRGSHELLQQQQQSSLSLKRSLTQRGPRDAPPASGGRSRNHFTVGSVGQNGKIFLRYACDNWEERRISNEKTGFVC